HDRAHRVAHEVRRLDVQQRAESGDVADAHAATVVEVDDFGGLPEPQQVGGQHPEMFGQCREVAFPAQFGAGPEFATVQQDHRVPTPGLQIAGGQTIDIQGVTLNL